MNSLIVSPNNAGGFTANLFATTGNEQLLASAQGGTPEEAVFIILKSNPELFGLSNFEVREE